MNDKIRNALFVVGVLAVSASPAFALSVDDNLAVSNAFDSGALTVSTVASGVIMIGAAITGLALVLSWLKK
jgi:hypothetical protein